MNVTPTPGTTPIRSNQSIFKGALCAGLALGLAAFLSSEASSDGVPFPSNPAVERGHIPPGRHLTESEAALWVDQGIDAPATHLLGQSEARQAGSITDLNLVVLLVEFPDVKADQLAHPPAHYEHLLFSRLDDGFRSVAEYLEESSRGLLHLDGAVRGWFTMSQKRNEYTASQGGLGYYPLNSQRLAEEAFFLGDDAVNFALFDNEGGDGVADSGDDDEMVDGIVIVHAGSGREGGGGTSNDFISVHWWVPHAMPMDGVFGFYFTLNPEDGNIGIFIHELGHLFGLPDLYDTDGGSFGTGRWSMMSGGFLIDDGRTPSDFDGWSKAKLGFVNVLQIQQNLEDVAIQPAVDSGQVYRLWRSGGAPTEYFLLENRQPRGLDSGLPGGGLLLYHVDEAVQTNDFPNHYKVAVEQADGLFQLENRFNDSSVGDAGDPFTAGSAFGRYTVPNNLDYEGVDSYVHVYDIRGPEPDGTMFADLNVEAGPTVEMIDLSVVELEGDGDGLVSAGELAGLIPRFEVERQPSVDLRLSARSLDPLGTLLDTDVLFGTVPAGTAVTPPSPLRLRVDSALPTDPYGFRLALDLTWVDAPGRTIPVEVGLGTQVGRQDDFETPDHGWTHGPVRPTAFDQWTYGPDLGQNGSVGFKHGYFGGGYLRGSDAELVSPPVLLPPHAMLFFDHAVEILSPDSTRIQAGGVVELSVNGGDWYPAVPIGGYPTYFGGNHLEWRGRGMFAGRLEGGKFYPVRVDLSGYSGSIRVRFRFFAEAESRTGSGWRVDNVRIASALTPVRVLFALARVTGDGVTLTWSLAEPLPSRVRWVRGADPDRADWAGAWQDAGGEGVTVDPEGARALPAQYWLQGLERDGSVSRWGPMGVLGTPGTGSFLRWGVRSNPVRGRAVFSVEGELPEGAFLEVYDVAGRLVHREIAPGANPLTWDGRDGSGNPVGPGVYLARLTRTSAPTLRVVILP